MSAENSSVGTPSSGATIDYGCDTSNNDKIHYSAKHPSVEILLDFHGEKVRCITTSLRLMMSYEILLRMELTSL
jgi:hypothetical protein